MSKQFKLRGGIIVAAVLLLTLTGTLFGLAWPLVTAEAGATLPPRRSEPQQPDKGDGGGGGNGKSTPLGAYIELQATGAPAGSWAVVQWQDSTGAWHDVEGWQGALGTDGYQRWWVAAKDFGTGPFQWVVKQGSDGPVWGSSDSFSLPGGTNEILRVEVVMK